MKESRDVGTVNFPVVGIGASAGGLDAFKKLLKEIPADSGMAYIFIQHMNSEHESLLPELLSKVTDIPVHAIKDEISLSPNHIYVMPSGKLLTAVDGKLSLKNRDLQNKNIKSIDLFFSSLGIVHQSFAVGVVLSGTASDGTLGLKVIKANGGITIAQDQSSAFDGMPQSAIRSGDVDFILPPEKIPAKLVEINRPFHIDWNKETKPTEEAIIAKDEEILKQILLLLKTKKNVDFSNYKRTTITRRIVRRMALNKITDNQEYLTLLRKNKTELDLLYGDFLISVTQFFRDPRSFEILSRKVLPLLFDNKKGENALRIWVAGCATGQEAYTMAICIQEYLKNIPVTYPIQIFATDISETAISKARNGIYDINELEGLSGSQIDEFFTKRDGHYQVIKSIRDMCVFAYHNLLQDPPFARIDIVSCRNVLIYMEPILQKRAFGTFHYALKENGFLLLGKSESPGAGPTPGLFETFDPEVKLFSKKGTTRSVIQVASRRMEEGLQHTGGGKENKVYLPVFQKAADELILSKYSPPGVIINEQYDIVQFRGSTGRWLEPSPGRASLNLIKMAKEGLAFELRNILFKVRDSKQPVVKEDVDFVSQGRKETITIEAIVLPADEIYYLVLFQTHPGTETSISSGSELFVKDSPGTTNVYSTQEIRIRQLEKELSLVREDMRAISEDQEASNEELQSANEELLSSSEELQTLNEELQTSTEEVQSTNEELHTLNHELIDRNNQLHMTNQYVELIIDTIRDPILILDRDLRIRTASKGFYSRFKHAGDALEGNYFPELPGCPWADGALSEKIRSSILYNAPFSDFEIKCHFPENGERILSINATNLQRISGDKLILLSFEDITINHLERLNLLHKKDQLEERIGLAVEATGIGIWDLDPVKNEVRFDEQCKRLFGFPDDQAIGYDDLLSVIYPTDRKDRDESLTKTLKGANNGRYESKFRITTKDTRELRWISSRGLAIFDSAGNAVRIVGTILDITREKISEQLLQESEERFRLASEASVAMIWMSGPDKLFIYFNKSWLKFTGKKLDQEMGNGWIQGIHPEDFNRCLEVYNKSFDLRQEFLMDYRLRYHDGSYRWISDSGAPRFSPAGLFEGYVGTCIDIHDQKMGQEVLEKLVRDRTDLLLAANNELEASNQNLSEFAYVASHDLQEPLRKINTFSQQLKEKYYENQTQEVSIYLNKITDASQRMSRLIKELLNYARLQNSEDAKVATDLNDVIRSLCADFELEISQMEATVDVGDLPTVKAIPMRMNQLFHNLFSNSLKFTFPGRKPHIIIQSTPINEEDKIYLNGLNSELQYAQIRFADNGIGFNPEFSERIFTIFQRLNARAEYEGTGIGLAICRKIVVNHNGVIFARSEENQGTEFRIILPVI